MLIRYGFDIELSLFQPTALITVMDIHPSRRRLGGCRTKRIGLIPDFNREIGEIAMAEIGPKERFEHRMTQPFNPVGDSGAGPDISAALKSAHALEYIAFQLGEINARLKQDQASKALEATLPPALAAGIASSQK